MDILEAFLLGMDDCEEFSEAVDIVKKNSSGKVWLIGGSVFRTIAGQLYNIPKPQIDLDFIVEHPVDEFDLPSGWREDKNRYGNPKLLCGKKEIDYMPLNTWYSIKHRNLEPTMENYLSGVPLTVQSIAYDIHDNKVIGDIGIDAIKRKVIEINYLHNAEYAAFKKGKSLHVYMKEKADNLGFTLIFPEGKSQF